MARIAEFKMIGNHSNYRSYWPEDSNYANGHLSGYVRISEWVDIDFPPRGEDCIPEEIAQLDAKLEEVKADFAKKVAAIEEAKANLLALSYQPTDQRNGADLHS